MQIPSSPASLLYYLRKLNVYNFTIYEAAEPNNGYCFFWNEINGKRGSCEIGSCLLNFVNNHVPPHVNHITIFSDTCGGQNRNVQIMALYLHIVRTHPTINVIEQKFMESGHSYMEVDSMHSSIEKAQKNVNVYSIHDWENIFKLARTNKSPYITKEMYYTDVVDLKTVSQHTISNKKIDVDGDTVNWLKVKAFRYEKEDTTQIQYKYKFEDEYKSMKTNLLKRRKTKPAAKQYDENETLPPLYKDRIPITKEKKKDLLTMCEKKNNSRVIPRLVF